MLRLGARSKRIGVVPITRFAQYACFHQSVGLSHRSLGRSRKRASQEDKASNANIPELPSNLPIGSSSASHGRNMESNGLNMAPIEFGSDFDMCNEELGVEDMKELDQQITASSEGQLTPILMKDVDITGQYAPLRNDLRWVRVPNLGVVLPLPSPETCSWQWRGWTSEGEFFSVGTRTAVFAPIPAGPHFPSVYSEDDLEAHDAKGDTSTSVPPPSTLSSLQGLLERAKARIKDSHVHIPRGFGSAGDLQHDAALRFNPLDNSIDGAIGSTSSNVASSDQSSSSTPSESTQQSPRVAPGLVDPATLPIRITVRGLRGVLNGPLGELIHRSPQTLARLLVDMHAAKHGPRGYVTEQREKRPPQILSAWSSEKDLPQSSKSTDNWMNTADPAAAFTAAAAETFVAMQSEDPVKVFGVEYEIQTDDPLVVFYDHNPALRAADSKANKNANATTVSKVGRLLTPGSQESLFTSAHSQFTTMRHSVTVVIDTAADCVHEISLSAPTDYWDSLWEGNTDSENDSSDLESSSVSDNSGRKMDIPSLSAQSIGVLHRGLRLIMDHTVVTDSAGVVPVASDASTVDRSFQDEVMAHRRVAEESGFAATSADHEDTDAFDEVPDDLKDAIISLHDRDCGDAPDEGDERVDRARSREGDIRDSEEEEELDLSGFYRSYASKSGAAYPVFVADDVLKEQERIRKQKLEKKRVPKE